MEVDTLVVVNVDVLELKLVLVEVDVDILNSKTNITVNN